MLTTVLAVGGCASDSPSDGDSGAPTSTPPSASTSPSEPTTPAPSPTEDETADQEAALTTAIVEYTDAYFAADYKTAVEEMWSERCLSDNEARNKALGEITAQKANYPEGSERPEAENITIDRFEGNLAVVTYDYRSSTGGGTVASQPWVFEDGEWKFDGC